MAAMVLNQQLQELVAVQPSLQPAKRATDVLQEHDAFSAITTLWLVLDLASLNPACECFHEQ